MSRWIPWVEAQGGKLEEVWVTDSKHFVLSPYLEDGNWTMAWMRIPYFAWRSHG